ncbi:MAG: VCBS repeat-containing protein, partial [Pseudohongiella sp.]|nr:VCBS repeat-containing protein [Pseudohongiella sp.]
MQISRGFICRSLLLLASATGCSQLSAQGVGDLPTAATASDGRYISWQEHLIDDAAILDFVLSGGDGLVMTDIDNDGYIDIVSVHESDSSYDSANFTLGFEAPPEGYVRIAFGSADPTRWHNITVAKELDAAAPEDAAVADMNGDGYIDILIAAELSHVLYLQNPGPGARDTEWPRLKLPMTVGRGSYIRVFAADLDGDGVPEVIAPNKGAQIPGPDDFAVSNPVSIFKVSGDPLMGDNWQEIELGRYSIPQNSEPVDLDGDG